MLPPPLAELLTFHAPLSSLQRRQGGAVTLLTPGVNALALNATYVPDDLGDVDLDTVRQWHEAQDLPVLVATTRPLPGAQSVARLRLGDWPPRPLVQSTAPAEIVVEQISRLHLGTWASVLAQAYGTPEWGAALGRHLAARLETERSYLPLLAYRQGEPVGALLWRAQDQGGAALLWGAPNEEVTSALLNTAADLGGPLRVSLPDSHLPFPAQCEEIHFSMLTL